ncbi:MAG: hypothetical protein ACJARL_001894 [Halopseudomonas sp.]|jgi:hypothetical protein|tara:strand:- start:604 stop:861 length:258 start_codon:yes stop_codon:yes gene_type:complete
MLIPGLPVVGAQQDVITPKRTVQPTAESEKVHEALAEVGDRRQRNQSHYPERRQNRARRRAVAKEPSRPDLEDLPSKGLLVDIKV